MKRIRKVLVLVLCLALLLSVNVFAAEATTTATTEATTESTGKVSDVSLEVPNGPAGNAGGVVNFNFKLTPNGVTINKVYIQVSSDFGFETSADAYKEIVPEAGKEGAPLNCAYQLFARNNIETGYSPVNFVIEYTKAGESLTLVRTINAKLTAAPTTASTATTEAASTEKAVVSVPKIVVTGYETVPKKVLAGQTFELTIHVKNTSNRTAVSNVKFDLSSAEGEFLPQSGSSTIFFDKIAKGGTSDIVIEMKAKNDLEQKPYALVLKGTYEDSQCSPFESTDNISIPVYQEARLTITGMEVSPAAIAIGEQANVMFSINNLGKGTLYNVTVSFKGDSIQAEDSYVGNILTGTTGSADVMVNGLAATMDDGMITAIVSYEDSEGVVSTEEQELSLFVMEYMEQGDFVDEMPVDTETKSPLKGILIAAAIVFVVIVAIVVVVIILLKKRKRKEEVDEDELS